MSQPTRVIVLTPPGRGAVATVRIEGPIAVEAVIRRFLPATSRRPGHTPLSQGRILFGRWGSAEGEEVVVCPRAADAVEVHCHGGSAAAKAIVDSLVELGCHAQEWTAWTSWRASDAITAEASVALAQARTVRTASILLDQHQGALSRRVGAIQELFCSQREQAIAELKSLLQRADLGLHLVQPWRVVIAGPPNVGKSSLLNALLGYERAIVFDQPGTTRDIVAAHAALDGWPVELFDTAGLHESRDALETAGIDLARQKLAEADLVVLVFDASASWTNADAELLSHWPRGLVVYNKSDLAPFVGSRPPGVLTSALTGEGIGALIEEITARLVPEPPVPGDAVPFTSRQVDLLRQALMSTTANDLAAARKLLGEIIRDKPQPA